jgi:hypothetical protein
MIRMNGPVFGNVIWLVFAIAAGAYRSAYADGSSGGGSITWVNTTGFPYEITSTTGYGCFASVDKRKFEVVANQPVTLEVTYKSCGSSKVDSGFSIKWTYSQKFRHGRSASGTVWYREEYPSPDFGGGASRKRVAFFNSYVPKVTFRSTCGSKALHCGNTLNPTPINDTNVSIAPFPEQLLLNPRGPLFNQ